MSPPPDDDIDLRIAGFVVVAALVSAAVLAIRVRPADAAPVLAALSVVVSIVHDLID